MPVWKVDHNIIYTFSNEKEKISSENGKGLQERRFFHILVDYVLTFIAISTLMVLYNSAPLDNGFVQETEGSNS